MSRDSVPDNEYESFLADSDKFFDEIDHETDTHSSDDIVKILDSMNILSESERETLNENLRNRIPDDAITKSLGESDYEFYGYLLLNVFVFIPFGKPFSSVIWHSSTHQGRSIHTEKWNYLLIEMR